MTTYGPVHVNGNGFAPEDIAMAAVKEAYPDSPKRELDYMYGVARHKMQNAFAPAGDPFDLENMEVVKLKLDPGETPLDVVYDTMIEREAAVCLHMICDAEKRYVGWQLLYNTNDEE